MEPASYAQIRNNPKFTELVRQRGALARNLTIAMLVIYFGFIALVAFAKPLLPAGVHYAANALDALAGVEAVVLLTEWNEFRALSPDRLKKAMRGDVVLDLRNVWDPDAMREAGFRYHSIGRP